MSGNTIPPAIETIDFSLVVGTTPILAFPPTLFAGSRRFFFMRIRNVQNAAAQWGIVWLSRSGAAQINAAGSYPLAPGDEELWAAPGIIPTNPLSLVANMAGVPVTIELG